MWLKWHHQYLSGNVANGHHALTTSSQLRTNATQNGEYWLFEIFRDGARSLNNVQFMEMTFQPISVLSQFYFPFHFKWISNMKRCEAISQNCFRQWTSHFNMWLRMEIHWSCKSLLFLIILDFIKDSVKMVVMFNLSPRSFSSSLHFGQKRLSASFLHRNIQLGGCNYSVVSKICRKMRSPT